MRSIDQGKFRQIKIFGYYIFAMFSKDGFGWFRIFGRGLKWKDTNKHMMCFSERYGYTKYIKIGKWTIAYLNKDFGRGI